MDHDEVSLRDIQVSSVLRMLRFNKSAGSTITLGENNSDDNDNDDISWKILVLDNKGINIVSSILRVNDLLKNGVTLHQLISQPNRTSLPDVPAVYFIEPTQNNVEALIKDISNDFYAEYYVNFISSLPRSLLEHLAESLVKLGKSHLVKQVYDQYLDFIVTEPELFSLELFKTYSILNNPATQEDQINSLCNNIAEGLYNTIITIGNIPIIRSPKGGPAEIVAEKLGSKLRDYVINTKSQNTPSSTSTTPWQDLERSVLIILDRNIDFASMFSHSWIYQCMVFDVFKLNKNTITIPAKEENANNKTYDLEPTDFFWLANAHLPFPEAAENVEVALNDYKRKAADITSKTGVQNLNDLDPNSNNDTLQFQEVVTKLPELTNEKNIIDIHMNIFASLLSQLEQKNLDTFFEVEQNPDSNKSRSRFLEILKDGKTNNLQDKLRSFIVIYLTSTTNLTKSYIDQVEQYFKENEYDISVLSYVYKLREFMQLSNKTLTNKLLEDTTIHSKPATIAASSLSGLYNLTEGRLQNGVGSLISGIKKLLPEKKTIPITNVVEAIMDPLNSSQKNLETTDGYLYFDPRNTRGSHTKKPKRQSYNKALVFVVGGGNYIEYQNLQEWAHAESHNPKKVMYGSTAIIPPNEFIEEITQITK